MVTRPSIVRVAPRRFQILDQTHRQVWRFVKSFGFVLMGVSIALFFALDVHLRFDAPTAIVLLTVGLLGAGFVFRAPVVPLNILLLEVDTSRRHITTPIRLMNGGGMKNLELEFSEVDELLFAMKDAPLGEDEKGPSVNAFVLYIRTFEGDLVPVVEACVDQERTFRVARFLADAFNVGIKQVGKGWKS